MKQRKVLFLFITLLTLFACNNEELVKLQSQGLQVNVDFLRLSDNKSTAAGGLVINADVPEVTVRWNTGNLCNLDTTQTTLKLSKGSATLPIKWMNKLESGTYGPEGVAFKAGVQIMAGDKSQYVPLVWAEKIDSTEILKSAIQTRAAGDMMPRVAQISMIPLTVNMNDVNGGSMYIGLTDVNFAVFDLSEFTTDLNIDMSQIPNSISSSQVLNFKWTGAGAPNFNFSVNLVAYAEGITQIGNVTYKAGAGTPTLNYVNSNLPAGNIPQPGGTYTFSFKGTYNGGIQVRAIVDGVAQQAGTIVTNKQPQTTVSVNSSMALRNIKFEYKRDDSNEWLPLQSTDRIQDALKLNIQISATPMVLSFSRDGGSKYSIVTTNDPSGWTATSNVTWMSFPASGVNNGALNVTATSTAASRTGIITIKSVTDPAKTVTVSVSQSSNYVINNVIIAVNSGSAAWGTAMGLTATYNNSATSPWTVVYKYPAGIYNPVPDNDGMTAVPWVGCKAYSEMPDGSDRGKWRLPTLSEVGAIQKYYPAAYWAAESYANNGGTGTTPVSSVFTGPAAYGTGPGSYNWLGRGNGGNYRCVKQL